MLEDTFLSEKNPVSHRWAIFEDDGLSAWLYLTEPDSEKIMADCWIYNRVQNPLPANHYVSKGVASPAPANYIEGAAVMIAVDASNFGFVWPEDGESVSFLDGNSLLGFIAAGQKRGYSRNLNKIGPWGNVLDESLYELLFSRKLRDSL